MCAREHHSFHFGGLLVFLTRNLARPALLALNLTFLAFNLTLSLAVLALNLVLADVCVHAFMYVLYV